MKVDGKPGLLTIFNLNGSTAVLLSMNKKTDCAKESYSYRIEIDVERFIASC
jgi:hypothetical protein